MATNTPMLIPKTAQNGLLEFDRQCNNMFNEQWNIREQMRYVDLDYIREKDYTDANIKAKYANRYGDSNKFQNITIPVVLPIVEAAVVYQSSVFLSGNPIFGCVANPKFQDAAMQMEAIMEDQSTRGGWVRHIQMFLRDGFKYNISALEVSWQDKVVAAIDSDPTFAGGKQGRPREVIWSGNVVERWDPYNTIWDKRVPITEVSTRGEFAGTTKLMSRMELKMFLSQLPNKMVENVKEAFESGSGSDSLTSGSTTSTYYIPIINPLSMVDPSIQTGTNWMAWAQASQAKIAMNYSNSYQVRILYARIIPSDFSMRVPSPNTPQVWKFIIINSCVLVYAERQTNAHANIPVLFGAPLEDGLSYQTKSLAQNVTPIQDVSSAMMNSVIAARRRSISDRGLYDPSKVGEAQINSDNPSAKIPVRPAAYGKPLSEAYYAIPFRDDQSGTIMQEMGSVIKLGDMISGQNPARAGQFVKGNKTQTEYSDVMNHSNGRDQNTSLLLEAQVFTPLKEILKLNILQYQGPSSIYYREKAVQVEIDPVLLRQAVIDFKISDGLTPSSKLINSDAFQTAIQVMGSSPQIAAEYNLGPAFSYLMKTQGAPIADFEKSKEQVAYESASNQWNQLAQLAVSKGQPAPGQQPKPADFGYLVDGQLKQSDEKPDALTSFMGTLEQNASAASTADSEQAAADAGAEVPTK